MSFRSDAKDDTQAFIDSFGETATVGSNTVSIIFDPAVLSIDEQTGEVQNEEPQAIIRTEDATTLLLKPGDTMTIDGSNYKIKASLKDDGYGMTTLRLNKI